MPSLFRRTSRPEEDITAAPFDFWGQFRSDGTIVPSLPSDSPWKSVGAPQVVEGISADQPRVVSWFWDTPPLPAGTAGGHYCLAVFVYSAASPIGRASGDLDAVVLTHAQVAQKNLHIVVLTAQTGGGAGGGSGGGGGRPHEAGMRESVQFHNPDITPRSAALVFDFRSLPKSFKAQVQLRGLPKPKANRTPRAPSGHPLVGCRRATLSAGVLRLEAKPSAQLEVRNVEIPPSGIVKALIEVLPGRGAPKGRRFNIDVIQSAASRVLGGGTFVLQTAGDRVVELPEQEEGGEDDGVEVGPWVIPDWVRKCERESWLVMDPRPDAGRAEVKRRRPTKRPRKKPAKR